MARQSQTRHRLGLTAADWHTVELARRDDPPPTEIVAHAVLPTERTALCGVAVLLAKPDTLFTDPFLVEQWGPIRCCAGCAAALRA
ncbi:hypothetical protein [Actinoplanes sp. NPDC049599]|uniref:hypothetical protein n=1 Tax=Actinoplanes sp. NPDC049599 TaxID=3363903 RepID=UPI0037B39C7E